MQISARGKIAAGATATILFGAIGSGVWELMFAPIAARVGRTLLTVFTLGLDSARDAIYRTAAKGHHELPSVFLYGFLAIAAMFVPLLIAMPVFVRTTLRRRLASKQPDELRRLLQRVRRLLTIMTCIGVVLGAVIFVRFLMHSYVNQAVTHFEQSMRIISPHLDVLEEKKLRSSFASIQNRREYVEVMARIGEIAQRNKKELPKFSAW